MKARALGPLRHVCSGCGGSCHGTLVSTMPDERAALRERARVLGVEGPFDGIHLRMEHGRCVFLDAEGRCRLHARFGPDAKPRVCSQYPRVVVRTPTETRIGLDPGCYSAHASWRHGPQTSVPLGLLGVDSALNDTQRRQERALLGVTAPGATVAGVIRAMCPAEPGDVELPRGFATRWVQSLQAARLRPVLERDECGAVMRDALLPVLDAAATWDASKPPTWPALAASEDAWAVETARRMVFLRLAPEIPLVPATAVLALGGAVACGWTHTDPVPFGRALAAWSRAMRAAPFWRALLPQPDRLHWLATGEGSVRPGI